MMDEPAGRMMQQRCDGGTNERGREFSTSSVGTIGGKD